MRLTITFGLLSAIASHGLATERIATLETRLLREGIPSLAEAVRTDGDPRHGAILFHQRGMACHRCHATGGGVASLGPDLAAPSSPLTAHHIVESMLLPSKIVDEKYRAVQIVKHDGLVVTGIIQAETTASVKLLLPLETGKVETIDREEIDEIVPARVSLMPVGQVNQLASRAHFLDLARYVLEIANHGPEMARRLQPDEAELQPWQENPLDHAAAISALSSLDLNQGRELYTHYCVNCHGHDGNKTLNPLARRFAQDPLKFGTDPYSMWKTISYGNGLMFPQAALLDAEERYEVVNYIREQFIREKNPSQYYQPTSEYLAAVNSRAAAEAEEFGPTSIEIAAGMIDGRQGRHMDYGPYVAHSIAFSAPANINAERFEDTTERALVVRLPGDQVVCYDAGRGSIAAVWQGQLADTAKTHHTSYKGSVCMTPGGPVLYSNVDDFGWTISRPPAASAEDNWYTFQGHYLHGGQVLFQYEIAGRRVEELPGVVPHSPATFSRTLRVAAGGPDLYCLIGRIADGRPRIAERSATLTGANTSLAVAVSSEAASAEIMADHAGGLWLKVQADADPSVLTVWWTIGSGEIESLQIPAAAAVPDFDTLAAGGPRHWPEVVHTSGVLGDPWEGYAADEISVPLANPWGSWMRTTAFDFFSDGAIAVSTLSGDVWIVRTSDPQLTDITWSRFATGLYEPLGLRIVDDVVYVRGRDRITRLHDLNDDGEADLYESFHQEGEIGPGYHAFLFDLQTDGDGHFYYARSGRKAPHEGAVVRVSSDGKFSEIVCRDFRHPNGLGAGGPHDWMTVSDNPDGVAVYNGVAIVREGHYYGYAAARTTPMLAVLPASADSSSGGQCWADAERWGPLSGHLIHTSYSRLAMFYIITQNLQPHPNGFAIRMPFPFRSGLMRARVNPVDGQVYVVGQRGWDTQAPQDGCLYRIRRVDGPTHLITGAAAMKHGIRLMFSCDLDPDSVIKSNVEVVRAEEKAGQSISYRGVKLVDAHSVDVILPEIAEETVSMRTKRDESSKRTTVSVLAPIRLTVNFQAQDGASVHQIVYATINSVGGHRPPSINKNEQHQ